MKNETNNTEHFHKHLDIMQGIINRMAGNSATCKNYCITLVAGLLALDQLKGSQSLIVIALLPVVLFGFLDAYYLSLERYFKNQYESTIQKWQDNDELQKTDLFHIEPSQKGWSGLKRTLKAFDSFSIWPFYLSLLIVVLAIWYSASFVVNCG